MSAEAEIAMNESRADRAAENLARLFHETYERLAPSFGYETREESRTSWDAVPETNKALMIAVCNELMNREDIQVTQRHGDMTDANVYHLWEFSDSETNQMIGLLGLEVVRDQAVERRCLPIVEKLVEALKAGGTIRCQYSNSETEPRPHP